MPLEFEGPTRTTSIGFVDARQEYGELLWRERFGATEIESLKRSLGSSLPRSRLRVRDFARNLPGIFAFSQCNEPRMPHVIELRFILHLFLKHHALSRPVGT